MNKTQLINYVSRCSKINRKESTAVVNWTLEGIMKGTKSRDGMRLAGFGNFKCVTTGREKKYNRRTRRYNWTKGSKQIQFNANKAYKTYVS